jgi:two-component system chemotaxis sensor kinase CheA
MVHDISSKLNKKVELKVSGESTELDKTVLEKINDPLVHCVRNSLDHGIESPEVRVASGKPETGTLSLNAFHQGGNIVIEIKDDGAGLPRDKILKKAVERGLARPDEELSDDQIYNMIFMAGFSTADEVSDVSGRGVGMDVVRRNVQALGGSIAVTSVPGEGTMVSVRLPLTLAILDGQTVRVGAENYIIPLVSIIESIQVSENDVSIIAGRGEVFRLRDEFLPVLRLYRAFSIRQIRRKSRTGSSWWSKVTMRELACSSTNSWDSSRS